MTNTLIDRVYGVEKFAGLDKESDHINDNKLDIKVDNDLSKILEDYQRIYSYIKNKGEYPFGSEMYNSIKTSSRAYTQEYINRFLNAVSDTDMTILGMYASVLMLNCPETKIEIFIPSWIDSIEHLGYKNDKDLTIHGNCGDLFGQWNRGRITLYGDCGHNLGTMNSGDITVNGDSQDFTGGSMLRGTIIVNGNCGDGVGILMKDGDIIINGRIGLIGNNIFGGNIYHYKEQIVKNGRLCDDGGH